MISVIPPPLDYTSATCSNLVIIITLPLLCGSRFLTPAAVDSVRWLRPAANFIAISVMILISVTITRYLLDPGYLDHIEPAMADVAWWYSHGHPLYPAWQDGRALYGIMYGPLAFQLNAIVLSSGASILKSKLLGIVCFGLSALFIAGALRGMRGAMLAIAACLIIAGSFQDVAYWDRPDSALLLCASLALLGVRRFDSIGAAIALGFLGGASVNLKIHGAFYILPFVAELVFSTLSSRTAAGLAAICVVSALPSLVLPFCVHDVSLWNYLAYLKIASNQGFDAAALGMNSLFAFVLLLPRFMPVMLRANNDRHAMAVNLVHASSVMVVVILGGKAGSGLPHLLPFLPAFASALARLGQALADDRMENASTARLLPCFLVLMLYTPTFLLNLGKLNAVFAGEPRTAAAVEARQLYAAFPGAATGIAGDATYAETFFRPINAFAGGRVQLEFSAWEDLLGGGVPPRVAEALITDCETPAWIIPKGEEPFSRRSDFADRAPLFSREFRKKFQERYTPVDETKHYVVWACSRGGIREAGLTDPNGKITGPPP